MPAPAALQPTTVVDLTATSPWCCDASGRGDLATCLQGGNFFTYSETIDRWISPNSFKTVLIYALPVLFAITRCTKPPRLRGTPLWRPHRCNDGRITLNPIKHIGPGGHHPDAAAAVLRHLRRLLFGYAKPVPVRVTS